MPELYPLLVYGMSQRQMAEALNAKGVPTPSQWRGWIGDQRIVPHRRSTPASGKWNQTTVRRILKSLAEVTERMKWWKRWIREQEHMLGDLLTKDPTNKRLQGELARLFKQTMMSPMERSIKRKAAQRARDKADLELTRRADTSWRAVDDE